MNIYEKTLYKFGVNRQIDKLIEEMGELTRALLKYKYNEINNVHEEFADVEVLLRQLRPVLNQNGDVDNWHKFKIERLEEMLNRAAS